MNDEIDVLPKFLQEVKMNLSLLMEKVRLSEMLLPRWKQKATYKTADEFAIEIGEILSGFRASISADKLPNGKMYYNIALSAC